MWIIEEYDAADTLLAIHPPLTRAPWSSRSNAVSFLEARGIDSTRGTLDSYVYPPAADPTVHHSLHDRYMGGPEELQEIIYTHPATGNTWILREISTHQRREQLGLADERAGLQERDMSWAGLEEKLAEEDAYKEF